MNAQMKRRLIAVSGIVIIVICVILAVVGGGTAASATSVAEAATITDTNKKVQVSGNVVPNSYATEDNVLTFKIYDPEDSSSTQLEVIYDGAASSTFGNDVTAICTGKMNGNGTLVCSELVTKCPSKYEDATDALGVGQLLGYGSSIYDKTIKVKGAVAQGSLRPSGNDPRLILLDTSDDGARQMGIRYDGALSDEITDGSMLVITGSLNADGTFSATDVALEG